MENSFGSVPNKMAIEKKSTQINNPLWFFQWGNQLFQYHLLDSISTWIRYIPFKIGYVGEVIGKKFTKVTRDNETMTTLRSRSYAIQKRQWLIYESIDETITLWVSMNSCNTINGHIFWEIIVNVGLHMDYLILKKFPFTS